MPAQEKIGVQIVAVDRLKNLFSPLPEPKGFGNSCKDIRLNENETIEVSYSGRDGERRVIQASFSSEGKHVFSFSIGQRGLEYIGWGSSSMTVQNSDSFNIKLSEGVGFTYPGGNTDLHPKKEEWSKFSGLADKVVDWTERVIKEKKILQFPLTINADAV